jgi:hypothetical protein
MGVHGLTVIIVRIASKWSVLLYSYFGSSAEDPCLACVETFGPKLRIPC